MWLIVSIVVDDVLTYTLLLFVCDLKVTKINVQCSLIQELMLYEFVLGHNTATATKNICCVKGESTVDHNIVTKSLKKFCSGCKTLDNQAKSGRPKSMDSKTVLKTIEAKIH